MVRAGNQSDGDGGLTDRVFQSKKIVRRRNTKVIAIAEMADGRMVAAAMVLVVMCWFGVDVLLDRLV